MSGAMKQTNQPFYASKTAIYEWLYSAYGNRIVSIFHVSATGQGNEN
jgi:hypothetical protein